ncbi:COP9 signalosome complex subunit 7 [Penicillium macrosclerotiorum]|uniref:COP9 signalosome complex subunit 7 n=1 Tax=Penicillium macrosclerotiorum TaxID=303699 RepID=UPI0025485B97|nr:COP9 signalosome complex subunit 7 [Penicillium macrosclerotiorum]KAJ5679540.1 COP9 signalosome complex subunit 7 [Penicillium macrosclerotiorum]
MDQTHSRALEALQPFIALATSNSATSPRFVANIVTNATSSPQTYVFAELLETPTIQALAAPDTPAEYQAYLKLLEIFAWGTWQDYQESRGTFETATPNLPKLSSEQSQKLRLLSLLSLASTTKPLTYQSLMDALSLSTTAELESLVTAAIYANLISARLSPASIPPTVDVSSVAPLRDVQPQSLPKMIALLTEWEARCGAVIADLEAEVVLVKTNAAKRHAKEQEHERLLEEATKRRQSAVGLDSTAGAGNGRAGKAAGVGRRLGGRLGLGMGGNKREADDIDVDDGFASGDNGESGSRMDIDEGAGSSRGSSSRHSKRILGRKT